MLLHCELATFIRSLKASHMSKYVFIFFSILHINSLYLNGQTENIKFNHIGVADGLSQGTIYSICQDQLGFLWFATENGLNRFDGYTFKVYKHNNGNEYSISSNKVLSLFKDSQENLWIGTNEGLNYFDRNNDRIIKDPKWPHNTITAIAEDENNNLWLGSNQSLFYLDLKLGTLKVYTPNDSLNNRGSLSNGLIKSIYIDHNKNVWIGTNRGLNLYIKQEDKFRNYFYDSSNPNSLSDDDVCSLLEDRNGRLWVGTADGLDLFINAKDDPREGKFIQLQNSSSGQKRISTGRVLALLEDDNQNLWISTENGGLSKLNLNMYEKNIIDFTNYSNNTANNNSLSLNSVGSIFQDKQHNIWIGTMGNGIDKINAVKNQFSHVKNEPGNKNSLSNNMVNVFMEDGDYLWIGTEGGLNQYNKKDGTFKRFVHDPQIYTSIGADAVWAVCKDKQGNLWVGTWAGGLNLFNYKNETFTHYYQSTNTNKSLSNNNIFSIVEDSNNNIWIGTIGGGIFMYNPADKTFTTYNQTNSNIKNYGFGIRKTKNDDLWIITMVGLTRFNLKQKKIEHFIHNINDKTSLSSKQVYDVFEDSKGNIWVGTDEGLNVLQKSKNGFKCYYTENGLPDNGIRSILEDDHGNLWLGTYNGLSKFIDAISLPEHPKFKNYTIEDGVQSNEFRARSCFKGADGMMYFGGVNGFNMFYPDSIKDNLYMPDVVFTDFLLFNKSVKIGEKSSPLNQDISLTHELKLTQKQSIFTFKFVALNYSTPEKDKYSCIMDGLEKEWNFLGNTREVTYRNLRPGKYIFRVRASNNDSVWQGEGASIKITILPFWWFTWYFKIIYAAIFVFLIIAIFYYRTSNLRKQKEVLEKTVEERTHDLFEKNTLLENQSKELVNINSILLNHQKTIEAQAEELKVTAANLEQTNVELTNLNATKDKFFSIIAHDLRSPFNNFLGLTEVMAEELPNLTMDKLQEMTASLRNSAINLFRLLENLLQWARMQRGLISYNREMLELFPIVCESVAVNQETAKNKDIVLSVDIPENLKVFADSNVIQMVVRNILSNALKFTKEEGKVSISAKAIENFVIVSIVDSGIGMSKALMENLFRLDATTNRKGTNGEPSTGLGLIICKELIEKQGGKLWVESKEGIGSVFHFSLHSSAEYVNQL
jgi:ligand-binding sensor domain-containing protein/signal transduction histidine kinase